MKLEHFLTSYTKITLKWLKDLNVRQDIINLLNENTGKPFSEICHSNIFLSHSSKAKELKAKFQKKKKKRNLIKLSKLSTSKGNYKQKERTTYGMRENICKP